MDFDDFFKDNLPGSEEDEDEVSAHPEIPWWGPPNNELGVIVPETAVVGRSRRAVVMLSHVKVFSTGAQFDFVGKGRGVKRSELHNIFDSHQFDTSEAIPGEVLRIGLQLADGARVSNLGGRVMHAEEPEAYVFHSQGGNSGSGSGRMVTVHRSYWLWPLPPEGSIGVWCAWPALEIPLTATEFDADRILDAASRVAPLWDDSD